MSVLKNAAGLRFSNGDPNSTSGFLVPGYYVFAKNNVDPKKIFKNVVAANHESNALAVANRQVDVATCNNEAIGRLEIAHPEKAAQIREIWRSPLIPSDPLVWRNSLPESTKKKIADFIFGYGVKGDVAHAKAILEKLQWGPFKPSTNAQLVPLRQLELFREKSKLQANAEMPAAEKAERIKKIDEALEQVVPVIRLGGAEVPAPLFPGGPVPPVFRKDCHEFRICSVPSAQTPYGTAALRGLGRRAGVSRLVVAGGGNAPHDPDYRVGQHPHAD